MLLNYRQQIKTPSSVVAVGKGQRRTQRLYSFLSFYFFLQQNLCLQNKEKSSLHLNPRSSCFVSNLVGDSSGSTPEVKWIC